MIGLFSKIKKAIKELPEILNEVRWFNENANLAASGIHSADKLGVKTLQSLFSFDANMIRKNLEDTVNKVHFAKKAVKRAVIHFKNASEKGLDIIL